MRKDICFNINQLILTTLHRLQLSIQTKTIKIPIMNVFTNFIPNKLITIDDKDPPWMNDVIKNKIKKRLFLSTIKEI